MDPSPPPGSSNRGRRHRCRSWFAERDRRPRSPFRPGRQRREQLHLIVRPPARSARTSPRRHPAGDAHKRGRSRTVWCTCLTPACRTTSAAFSLGAQGEPRCRLPGSRTAAERSLDQPGPGSFSHDGDARDRQRKGNQSISTYAGRERDRRAVPPRRRRARAVRIAVGQDETPRSSRRPKWRRRLILPHGDADGLRSDQLNVMTGQRAACWAVLTTMAGSATTNAGTGNISGFAIAPDGPAALLDADGVTAVTGGNPTDMAMSQDGKYLYARVASLSDCRLLHRPRRPPRSAAVAGRRTGWSRRSGGVLITAVTSRAPVA